MKRNYLFYWFAVLLLLFSPARSYAEVYSGSCGANVNWTLDTGTGLLKITGSGEMEDYDENNNNRTPWYYHSFYIMKCTIGNGVTSIGNQAFYCCSRMRSITIPNSVTNIGSYALGVCHGLTSITIPNSVTSIGDGAFSGCDGLTSITIPNSVTSIESYAFCDCTGLTSITIPNSVTSIGDDAFYWCTGLTSITIGNSVTSIGSEAFRGCTNIKTIYCRSQEPPVCDSFALKGIDTSNCTLFVPEGAEALYKAADQWKEFFFIEEITGIDTPRADDGKDTTYDIYDMSGRTVRKAATTTDGLKPGLYIINGRKVLVE